jgi:gamma-glutamylcyclotransferase
MDEAVTFLNFAYGSNMLSARLRERVPSARPAGTACLPGFSLRWHKVSVDGSGKCNVVEVATPGACV